MSDEIHFAGDPATESAQRHLERVLKSQPRRRWPWGSGDVPAGGTAFRVSQPQQRRQNGREPLESGRPSK